MLTVSAVTDAERNSALRLLFSHLSAAEQSEQMALAQSLAEAGQLDWGGLLAAREHGDLLGVCLTVAQPDRSLGVWIPVIASDFRSDASQEHAIAAVLLDEVARRQDDDHVAFTQCLLEETPSPAEAWLLEAGFERMAELSFLHRDLTAPLPELPVMDLDIEVYAAGKNDDRFAALVERSYSESLDCPNFTGLRTGSEALESHRTTGLFREELWRIFRTGGSDAGVLLCADQPELEAWELAYMGVSPEFRGRTMGKFMVIYAMHAARDAGRQRMQLAVDSANGYAKAIYATAGFEEQCSRTVYLRRRGANHRHIIHES